MKFQATSASERGSALVLTLLIFAIGIALVVPMYKEYTLFLKRSGNSFAAEQGYAYLRGGEELAVLVLRNDDLTDQVNERPRDDLTELWAQEGQAYPLDEGGWLRGGLDDLQGRFNLNSLLAPAPNGQRYSAPQEQFIRLLQVLEEPPVDEQDAILITEAILDWLDADEQPRDFGAEDDHYYDISPPYRAANRLMSSVSELRSVAFITPGIYLALAPFLTVSADDFKINIHTAPVQVLRTLNSARDYQPLSVYAGAQLLELRDEEGFENLQAFLANPVFEGRALSPQLQALLSESSNYFLFSGVVDVAGRESRLYSVLHRQGQQVQALVRASGSL